MSILSAVCLSIDGLSRCVHRMHWHHGRLMSAGLLEDAATVVKQMFEIPDACLPCIACSLLTAEDAQIQGTGAAAVPERPDACTSRPSVFHWQCRQYMSEPRADQVGCKPERMCRQAVSGTTLIISSRRTARLVSYDVRTHVQVRLVMCKIQQTGRWHNTSSAWQQ